MVMHTSTVRPKADTIVKTESGSVHYLWRSDRYDPYMRIVQNRPELFEPANPPKRPRAR